MTAGGIITQAKKIRTRKGDPMMFATLDDLEGSVEILVFGKALAEYEGALGVDAVVLVRGRVDHKDADKTCLVVQSVERFEPTPEEVEAAREAGGRRGARARSRCASSSTPPRLPATIIDDLKHVLGNFPGESEVVLDIDDVGRPAHAAPRRRLPRRADAGAARRARAHPRALGAARAGRCLGGSSARRALEGASACTFARGDPSFYRWTGGGGSLLLHR